MAFQHTAYRPQFTGSIAELIGAPARARAAAERAKGQARASSLAGAGQAVTGTIGSLLQDRAEAPRRAEEAEIRRLTLEEKQRAAEMQAQAEAASKDFAQWIGTKTEPPSAQEVVARYGPLAPPFLNLLKSMQAEGPDLMAVNPGDTVLDKRNPGAGPVFTAPPRPSAPINVAPGNVLLDPDTKQPIYTAPPRDDAPTAGSFEDYVRRTAQAQGKTLAQLTPGDVRKAKAEFEAAGRAPQRPEGGVTPNAALESTLKLRDRFVRETQSAQAVKTQYDLMKASLEAVKNGAAAPGSQGVLVTFQKILDPTSVVRESEYARSASGLSLINRLEGQWMKIEQGGAGVKPDELEKFVKLAEQFVRNQARAAQVTKDQIDGIAREFGLKPENITRELGIAASEGAPTEGTEGMVNGVPAVWKTVDGKTGWYAR